jgi:DMSO/TMAO reductase YedYZ heme-binding membrane subunit
MRPPRKKLAAYDLLKRCVQGPHFGTNETITRAQYNLWASTWVVPHLIACLPELKGCQSFWIDFARWDGDHKLAYR